ncbi:MAG: hypothetical protein KatS3mg027_2303 [Bacteroidia bacterium]|nr:MAG: hypothetical protein KatS3mg027_2303 [Bacteroidia bacterium]
MVSVIEDHPEYLIKPRKISLEEFFNTGITFFKLTIWIIKLHSWKALSVVTSMPQQHLFDQPEKRYSL